MIERCLNLFLQRKDEAEETSKMIQKPVIYSILIFAVYFIVLPCSFAQELEPRAYANAPVDLNFVVAGYQRSQGELILDPLISIENTNSTVDAVVFGYLRTLDVAGMSAKVGVVIPYVDFYAQGNDAETGQLLTRKINGLADPSFYFTMNFYGAPALSLQEFRTYQQDTIVGFSLKMTPPLGHYQKDKIINIGTNRWSIKPELGISKAINRWILEATTNVTFYSENDEFSTNQVRKQEPVYSLQGNLTYTFKNKIWLSYGMTYYTGGKTRIDGIVKNDLQNNSRTGLTIAIPVNKYNSIKILTSTGLSTRTGTDFDSISLFWQHRWGAGL